MSDELAELRKISKILILANARALKDELSKYATTDDRKRAWVLINGQTMSKDIAQSIGITTRSVDMFLEVLERAELVENLWGRPPKRILDYVPASWLELMKVEETKEERKSEEVD